MASVTPRKNRDGSVSWRVQFRVDGKMRQETFPTEKAAREFGAVLDRVGPEAALAVRDARLGRTQGVPTLAEFVDTYLDPESGMLTGIEKGTRVGYRNMADRSFLPILGPYPIDSITKDDIGRWVTWQEGQDSGMTAKNAPKRKIAAKTVKNRHALLSSIMAAAVPKYRADNPAFKTRLTRGRKREAVFLSAQEFTTLLHFVPEYYRPLVKFLAGTGARWGEATALLWGDVELSTTPPTFRIEKAWKKGPTGVPVLGPPKSPKSRRTVALTLDVVEILGARRDGAEFLFPGRASGKQIWYGSFNTRIWKTAVKKANDKEACEKVGLLPIGKQPNIHDLRHTHASWLIAGGAPLPFIQQRLGHEKITTTVDTYGHLLPDAHVQMVSILDQTMVGVIEAVVYADVEEG